MVSMTMEQNAKRFCPPSHGRLGAELELSEFRLLPQQEGGRSCRLLQESTVQEMPESPGRQAHFHHGTYVRIGPQVGSRVRIGAFKALWPMGMKTWVFSVPGITTRMGHCPQNRQGIGLWDGFLGRDSRGSVFTPALSTCKKCISASWQNRDRRSLGKLTHPVRGYPGKRTLDRQRGA